MQSMELIQTEFNANLSHNIHKTLSITELKSSDCIIAEFLCPTLIPGTELLGNAKQKTISLTCFFWDVVPKDKLCTAVVQVRMNQLNPVVSVAGRRRRREKLPASVDTALLHVFGPQ